MENQHINDLSSLIQQLKDKEGEAFSLSETAFEAAVTTEMQTPTSWIIRVVTMLGAWIAAACFFGMIGLMGIFDSPKAIFILGILLMAFAIVAFRSLKKSIFLIPVALTASITGQICFGMGLEQQMKYSNYNISLGLEMLIQVILFFATTNNIQKFIATVLFNCFWVGLLFNNELYEGVHAVLAINALVLTAFILWEEKILARYKFAIDSYQPFTAGVTLSFLCLIFIKLIEQNNAWNEINIHTWWISTAFIVICLAATIYKVSFDFNWNILKTLPIIVIFIPLMNSVGILAGILILLLGYYHKSIWYISMGILALAVFISIFYYNLQMSLWLKSLILMGSGLLFLGIFFLLKKYNTSFIHQAD